jgi:hypothetical protein
MDSLAPTGSIRIVQLRYVRYLIIIPYGSKHFLRRYLTPQIIPQTLPKKVFGSIGIYKYIQYMLPSTYIKDASFPLLRLAAAVVVVYHVEIS